jgi:hypothetical protein
MLINQSQLQTLTTNTCRCAKCRSQRDDDTDMLVAPTMSYQDVAAGLTGQPADDVRAEDHRRLAVFASSDPDVLPPTPPMDWGR